MEWMDSILAKQVVLTVTYSCRSSFKQQVIQCLAVIYMDVMYAHNTGAVIGELLCLPHPRGKSLRDLPSVMQKHA